MESEVHSFFAYIRQSLTLQEVSGALGDLGTLLPILISLSVSGQISLTGSLWFGGIFNILSGLLFKIPMCVQPMQAISSVALASKMPLSQVMSAGLGAAALIFFIGATRTITVIGSLTPLSVVRGLQLGTAVSLLIKAHDIIANDAWSGGAWSDNFEWALAAFVLAFGFYHITKVPTALILFVLGLIFAIIRAATSGTVRLTVGFNYPRPIAVPTPDDFQAGFINAGLGQVPLTLLNSVIAVSLLAKDLFPKPAIIHKTSTSRIAMSVGLMNLVGCWFGSLPYCHGSGGLMSQYRFGARTEISVILLGLGKLLVGILFSATLDSLLKFFPSAFLGVMLFAGGIELCALAARSVNVDVVDPFIQNENNVIMMVTMGLIAGFKNDAIGFVGGCITAILLFIQRKGLKGLREKAECMQQTLAALTTKKTEENLASALSTTVNEHISPSDADGKKGEFGIDKDISDESLV